MKVTAHYRNDPERGLTDPVPELGGRRFIFRLYSGDVAGPLFGTLFGEKWFEEPFPRWVVRFTWEQGSASQLLALSLSLLSVFVGSSTGMPEVTLAGTAAYLLSLKPVLPFIAFRWPFTQRACYLGFKLFGVDSPAYKEWLCGPEDVFEGSQALCLTIRPFARLG